MLARDNDAQDTVTQASYQNANSKRSYHIPSEDIQLSISQTKLARYSLPTIKQLPLLAKSISPTAKTRSANEQSRHIPKLPRNSSCSIALINKVATNKTEKEHQPSTPAVQCNIVKTIPIVTKGSEGISNMTSQTSAKGEKDCDVYTNLLENYRYLITPKSWSVTEFMSETKDRYIVFFNPHVVKENGILVSVMRKSLIIDKGAKMNYSVHGLPVDINGTILPLTLDNTKKLLSILHIFDKMQVCNGIGNDLNIMQTDFVFKDNCRFWRHKHCKIVLIKVTRCPVCTETRDLILERKIKIKNELITDSTSNFSIKQEKQ